MSITKTNVSELSQEEILQALYSELHTLIGSLADNLIPVLHDECESITDEMKIIRDNLIVNLASNLIHSAYGNCVIITDELKAIRHSKVSKEWYTLHHHVVVTTSPDTQPSSRTYTRRGKVIDLPKWAVDEDRITAKDMLELTLGWAYN